MTAIGAFFAGDNSSFVIGDLAVSGEGPGGEGAVPTIGSLSEVFAHVPGHTGTVVTGCMQKVVICHDRLVVAWTGSVIAAKALLRELAQISAPDVASLRTVVESQDDSALTKDLELLGFLAEPAGVDLFLLSRFHIRGRTLRISVPDIPHFLGTGADRMRQQFDLAQKSIWSDGGSSRDEVVVVASKVLVAAGQLMAQEMTGLQPLQEYFGGGYEIACWGGGRFEKIEGIAHLFWRALVSDEGVALRPIRLLKPTYVGSTLVVHATNLQPQDDAGSTGPIEAHIIRAPHQLIAHTIDLPKARFGGEPLLLCNYMTVEVDNRGVASFISLVSGGTPKPVRISDTEKGAALEIDPTFLEGQLFAIANDQATQARAFWAAQGARKRRSKTDRNRAKRLKRKGRKTKAGRTK
jgi:hypothetical protein